MGSATTEYRAVRGQRRPTDREPTPTLQDLVSARVGKGRPLTYAAFREAAVDPESGERVSSQVAQSINAGLPIKMSPTVLAAIAAGIGEDPERVRRAAAREYIGLELPYNPELDYMPTLDDMADDPLPDEHGSDIVVTAPAVPGTEDVPTPKTDEAIRKRLRRMEQARANQQDKP